MSSNRDLRVFLSYSHEGARHDERVLRLSQRLREDGFDCHLDRYDPNPAQGWPRWMAEEIARADFVLLVCTETYCRRVMGEEALGVGHGVIWEANLIYQYIYDSGTRNDRFVPLLLGDAEAKYIPPPLRGVTHYQLRDAWASDPSYARLCAFMRGAHRVSMAPLGQTLGDVMDAERSATLAAAASAGDAEAVVASLCSTLPDRADPCERYWIYATLGAIGGKHAAKTLRDRVCAEPDAFARSGAERALQLLGVTA